MIEVNNLEKTYRLGFFRKAYPALRSITFRVEKGEIFGFIGPNGAGKSTTMKILLGLVRFNRGEVKLMGEPIGKPLGRQAVGFLPENQAHFEHLTGEEFLRLMGRLSNLTGQKLRDRIRESTEAVNLQPEWLHRKLRFYSKGMAQRLGLAQAILTRPELLILDEPMTGLDPLGRRDVRRLLSQLRKEGVTIFYSSHVLSDVEEMCDRAALIIGGKIRRCGTIDDLRRGEKNLEQVLAREVMRPDS